MEGLSFTGHTCLVLIQTTIVVYCNFIESVENLNSATYFRFSKISNFYIFEIRTFKIHTFAITPSKSSQTMTPSCSSVTGPRQPVHWREVVHPDLRLIWEKPAAMLTKRSALCSLAAPTWASCWSPSTDDPGGQAVDAGHEGAQPVHDLSGDGQTGTNRRRSDRLQSAPVGHKVLSM